MKGPASVDRMIFGGSFDPPHRGHIAIIQYVFDTNLTRELELIPAAVSPFKSDAPPTDGAARLALLEAALQDLAESAPGGDYLRHIHLRTLELKRPPPSYSADTCSALRAEFPGQRIGLLIGSDSLRDFERWTRVAEIVAHHPIYVFRRRESSSRSPVSPLADLWTGPGAPELHSLSNALVDCSSTELRAGLAAGRLSDCLTPAVARRIAERGLYGYRRPD